MELWGFPKVGAEPGRCDRPWLQVYSPWVGLLLSGWSIRLMEPRGSAWNHYLSDRDRMMYRTQYV